MKEALNENLYENKNDSDKETKSNPSEIALEMKSIETHDGEPTSSLEDEEFIPEPPIVSDKKEDMKKESFRKSYKRHLVFKEKEIGIFKLLCHLSNSTEIILMVLGVLSAIISGASMPIIALLVGVTIGEYSEVMDSRLEGKTDIEKASIFLDFEQTTKETVNKFLYIGILIFCGTFLSNFLWEFVGLRQIHNLKEKYFAIILKQEQDWFDSNNPFEFATKVQAQVDQIELGLGEKIGQSIENISTLISGLIFSFLTSWKLTLIVLTMAPFMGACLYSIIVIIKKTTVLSLRAYQKAGGMAEEILYNIKTVVSFSNFSYEESRFNDNINLVHTLEKDKAFKMGLSVGFLTFFSYCSFSFAVIFSRGLIARKEINSNTDQPFSGGDVLTVTLAAGFSVMAFDTLAPNINIINDACQASSDYFSLYERKVKLDLSESTLKPPREKIQGKIEFKNISFHYPSDKTRKPVLDGLDLTILPGQKVAIVGESGCGKSTTVNLIERLYEAQSGEILIDDINIKKIDLNYLRSLIGYVQQEPILFNNSIRDNIIFGREKIIEQEFNNEVENLLQSASKDAFAMEFINKKEEKFDYIVGVRGSKLSGGQKQRIAIARAILLKPKILILDEATSALDCRSEKEVQKALDNISEKNVTTIIIAHRLSTIKNSDVIFALKNGKIQEKGTHEELLKLDGYYAGLVQSQISEEEFSDDEEATTMIRRSSLKKVGSLNKPKTLAPGVKVIPPEKKMGLRLFDFLQDHKFYVIAGTICCFGYGTIHPLTGLVRALCVNALSSPDEDIVKNDGLLYGIFFLLIAIGNGVFFFFKVWSYQTLGSVLALKMRQVVIKQYLRLHMGYYDIPGNSPGALLARLSTDTTQMNQLVQLIIGDVVQTLGVFIVGIIIGLIYDYRLMLIGMCFTPFIVIAQILVSKTRISGRAVFKEMNIEAGSVLSECVNNTKSIFAFNFQEPAVELYISKLENAKKDFLKNSIFKGLLLGLGSFANYAGRAALFHFSGGYILNSSLNFENMTKVIETSNLVNKGASDGLRGLGLYNKARLAFNSVFNIIDTKPQIDLSEEGNKNKAKPDSIKGKIEFKDVSFAYPTKSDTLVLRNINITIEPGQSAALVGYSGCGKSSIIQLLERYYDVTTGEILIDGINIKDYDINELRKKIGLVSQEPVLFKRSVYENILYGKLEANKREVYQAAKRACIEKFFNNKEMGTKETPVSGGEKQRLAIARAFLKDPKILLLDEATSALDKESEMEVQKSIDELMINRTSLTVAHRLSTIVNCDIIFVLENGKIIEQGNHNELMQLGKKYAYLYKASQCG